MREAARFLEALGDILEIGTAEGMESDQMPLLLEAARKDVETLRLADPSAVFELGEGDVFWRGRPLAGTVEWPWRARLVDAGLARMTPPSDESAFRAWVTGVLRRLAPSSASGPTRVDARPPASGPPALATPPVPSSTPHERPAAAPSPPGASLSGTSPGIDVSGGGAIPSPSPNALPLDEEAERVWWLYGEAANRGMVPRRESEDLVNRLFGLLDRGPARARGRDLDDRHLTTPHLVNVALLSMGTGRHLAFDGDEVRALGLAGLYHDVGRVRPGADETVDDGRAHPATGARLLMDSGSWFAVAAVAAYEHHLTWRGTGGYPSLHFVRPPHQFTRIITVCDIFDTLRTERAHRPALTLEATCEYLRVLAGKTLDPEIVTGVVGYAATRFTHIEHPRTRPEADLSDLRWLPDAGFDPDDEPRPMAL